MKILHTNLNDNKEIYRLTHAKTTGKMRELAGSTISVKSYVVVEDVKRTTGEVVNILYLETDKGSYATNSATFIESFIEILQFFGTDFEHIACVSGVSRNGRTYITCELID